MIAARTALAAALVLAATASRAVDDSLDPAVPTPREVLGHAIGDFHTDYRGVMRYAEALAAAVPDRVRLVPIGESWERRPLVLLVISSPANMARLDAIKADLARLADPRSLAASEEDALVRRTPAVTWNNFGNDGNESASVEAALELAWRLAASRGGDLEQALTQVVAVINVCHNPESRERFVTWFNAHQVGPQGTADPQALEHHGPWAMDTNHNHYQTDLNRDAAWATQPETRHLVRAYNEWRPVTFVDHHGETENFFFPPVALPVNPHIPEAELRWLEDYGRAIAAAADRRGWSYFTGEVFDAFYPGYWDAYPLLRGTSGLTFETTGGGSDGLRVLRDDDTVVTLRDGVERHVEGALAVLRLTAERREERLRAYVAFRRSAAEEGRRGPLRAYALVPGTDPGRVAEIVSTLLLHGVEVRRTTREADVEGARGYRDAAARRVRLPAGTWVIALDQPDKRLIDAILEPRSEQQAAFLAEERRKREENRARGRNVPEVAPGFYDVTAWALPLAYDVEAWALPRLPAGTEPVADPPRAVPTITGVPARAAYLVGPRTLASTRLAFALLREGFKVAVARRGFTTAGREWPAGTFVMRTERNPSSLHDRLPALAAETGADVWGVDTSWTEKGIDLGSALLDSLEPPRIAVAADDPTDEAAYGEVWFLLEQRLGQPFTALRTADIPGADLSRYDVIVLPDGDAGEYLDVLGTRGIERLTRWVRDGGVLVCSGGAARLAGHRRVRWTQARLLGPEPPPDEEEEGGEAEGEEEPADVAADDEDLAAADALLETERPLDREQRRREAETEATPGAIFAAEVDPAHFLGYGYEGEVPVLVSSPRVFTASRTGANVVRIRSRSPLLAGFTWPEAEARLRGASYAIDEPVKRGHVVVFAENPNFRHVWRGLEKLFTNALLLAPSLR